MSDGNKIDVILRELGELKAALVQRAEPKLDMSRDEVMAELGFEPHEKKKFYNLAYNIGLKSYRDGHYRRCDVKEKLAQVVFKKEKPLRAACKKQGRAA